MHRPDSLTPLVLMVMLGGVVACPNEQVDPTGSLASTGDAGVATAEPTTMGTPTTGGASTGSSGGGGPTEASSTGTSTVTSTGEGSSGTGSGGSSSTTDSGIGGTGSTGEPPQLADCFGCLCDINVSFCRIVFAGVEPAAFAGPEAWCPIVEAGTQDSGCVLYPPRCGEAPTCECLPTMNGGCFCNEVEPGEFQVACPLP